MTLTKSEKARQPRSFHDASHSEGSCVLVYLWAALRRWMEALLETIHKNQILSAALNGISPMARLLKS